MYANILDAMSLIEKRYLKILKIDVNKDSYIDIKVSKSEVKLNDNFTDWYRSFADFGVHPLDIDRYLSFIETYADKDVLYYRRKNRNNWEWVSLEVLEANDSTKENPQFFFFIRECNNKYINFLADSYAFSEVSDIVSGRKEYLEFCGKHDGSHAYVLYVISDNAEDIVKMIKHVYKDANVFRMNTKEFIVVSKHKYAVLQNEIETVQKIVKKYGIKFVVGAGECGDGLDIAFAQDKAYNAAKKKLRAG